MTVFETTAIQNSFPDQYVFRAEPHVWKQSDLQIPPQSWRLLSFFRGKAFTHLVKQSTITKRYLFPVTEEGKGSKMSKQNKKICNLSKEAPALKICIGDFLCLEDPS